MGANGNFLTTSLTLTSLKQYWFKVRAKSGSIIAGEFSPISEYFISPAPPTPNFDTANIVTKQDSIKLSWIKPTLNATTLPILGFKIYWNEGFKTQDYSLLAQIENSDALNFLVP